MNSSTRISPTVAGLRFVIRLVRLDSPVAMVIEIDTFRLALAAVPSKDQPPSLVDADRVALRQSAAQPLEVIAGRHAQILIGGRIVDHLELAKDADFEIGRDVLGGYIIDKECTQPFVPKAYDHTLAP